MCGSITTHEAADAAPSWGESFRHIGAASIGSSVSQTMTITNEGDQDLVVSNITSSNGQFTFSETNFTVAPGGSHDVSITFTPTLLETQYSTLTITSNDPDNPSINVIINGIGKQDVIAVSITESLPGGASIDLVSIPAGTFTMGSPDSEIGRDADEGPQHEVTISQGFYLGKYELTQEQWQSVMGTTPWTGQPYTQNDPNSPATCLLWEEVPLFTDQLNQEVGAEVYRMPTEAEWHYACRAGTPTRWSFGEDEARLGLVLTDFVVNGTLLDWGGFPYLLK